MSVRHTTLEIITRGLDDDQTQGHHLVTSHASEYIKPRNSILRLALKNPEYPLQEENDRVLTLVCCSPHVPSKLINFTLLFIKALFWLFGKWHY
jgi:hypothetical protein